jgi:hypothetical protein
MGLFLLLGKENEKGQLYGQPTLWRIMNKQAVLPGAAVTKSQ